VAEKLGLSRARVQRVEPLPERVADTIVTDQENLPFADNVETAIQ
jgi:hypothetical protein